LPLSFLFFLFPVFPFFLLKAYNHSTPMIPLDMPKNKKIFKQLITLIPTKMMP
jgi:hypothetical protein